MTSVSSYNLQRVFLVTKELFWNADTTTIRLILALSSLLFTIGLMATGVDFNFVGYRVMKAMAPKEVWASLFFLHFLGLSWRFLDPIPRIGWALAINGFGLLIWVASTVAINSAFLRFVPGTSVELVLCCFAAWALFRTGLRKEILTP